MTRAVFIEDRLLMLNALRDSVDWAAHDIAPIGFFTSCDDGLPFILSEKPDVVVTDIVMHGMDGLELSQYLHDRQLDVKVIIVSAYSRFDYAQKALQAGVFDYFEKPLDFDALAASIREAGRMSASNRQTREFIRNHMAFYRERFYTRLLMGQLSGEGDIAREAAFLDVTREGRFAVLACRVKPGPGVDGLDAMDREMQNLSLAQALREAFSEQSLAGPYRLHEDELVFVLENCDPDEDEAIVRLVTAVLERFGSERNVAVHAGISGQAPRLEDLKAACDAACLALDTCFLYEETCVIHTCDLQENSGLSWRTFYRLEGKLLRAIDMQDNIAVQAAIEEFRRDASHLFLHRQAIKTLIKGLLFKVESLHVRAGEDLAEVVRAIDSASGLEEILARLRDYCLDVCNTVRNQRSRYSRQLLEGVRADIDEHFREEQYGLNEAASRANISPNYLSSMFKKEYGLGIHEYITARRIDLAKDMLIHTEKSIGEIGTNVGYPNPYYFSAGFKKSTGLAPTEYRRQNRKQGEEQ